MDPMSDEARRGTEASGQSLTARISNVIVALHKDFYGKGPTEAKAVYHDDLVVVVLRGGFTRVEETLLAEGRGDAVFAQRAQLEQAMRDRYCEAIRELTAREVIGFMTAGQADPPMMLACFVLAPEEPLAGGDAA